jgi:hypothetical protein
MDFSIKQKDNKYNTEDLGIGLKNIKRNWKSDIKKTFAVSLIAVSFAGSPISMNAQCNSQSYTVIDTTNGCEYKTVYNAQKQDVTPVAIQKKNPVETFEEFRERQANDWNDFERSKNRDFADKEKDIDSMHLTKQETAKLKAEAIKQKWNSEKEFLNYQEIEMQNEEKTLKEQITPSKMDEENYKKQSKIYKNELKEQRKISEQQLKEEKKTTFDQNKALMDKIFLIAGISAAANIGISILMLESLR